MTFDLYANINDIVDGLAFAGDMRFFVKDDDQIKAETKIRMPEKNKETKTEKDVTAKVPDENDKNFENKKEVYLNEPDNIDNKHTNIDSKSTTNNDRLPKTGTVSEVFMSLVAGIMFTLGAFLGLKKKDQD